MPLNSLKSPGFSPDLKNIPLSPLYKISYIKVDFPEPETPVIQVKVFRGIFTSIFFKLCSSAPIISKYLPFPFLLLSGISIFNLFDRYFPVNDLSDFRTSSTFPSKTISPPFSPAPGPISII